LKQRLCVETEIRRHVHGARPYAGSTMPFATSFGMQWGLSKYAANAAKVRPLGLAGGATG
jgi:hypothetical protein